LVTIIKKTINDMHQLARRKGGKCLSKKYITARLKLGWQCAKGHKWKATPSNVKTGFWCPYCAQNVKKTIHEMHLIAKKKNGLCLSKKYFNAHKKLKWQCNKGHIWLAAPDSIYGSRDTWCPYCAGKHYTINDMHKIAHERGGLCLSKEYINDQTKLTWQCFEGHIWLSTPSGIKGKSWCPKCHGFFKEEICRTTFEQIFETEFIKYRPKWLKSSSNYRMEFDGYSEKLKIAFEYNGEQHFKTGYWIKDKNILKKRVIDDQFKRNLALEKGIKLIVITYKNNLLKLPFFIKKELKDTKIDLNKFNFNKDIDFNKAYRHKPKIQQMKDLAKQKNGICLSNKFVDVDTKLKWQCSEGHSWIATPDAVKRGTWCPKCGGNYRYTLNDMKKIAASKNGECLSIIYNGVNNKLKWKCNKGHIWLGRPNAIIHRNVWCTKCSGHARLTMNEMQELAKQRGGECLVNNENFVSSTNIQWKCSKNHIWFATPNNVKGKKSWCPKCSKRKKH
jgi:hypothetical protein